MYDLIIIGAGPAGLSAGLYAARAKMNTLIVEKEKTGGQITTTDSIENYPGGIVGESGPSLIKKMADQIDNFGLEIRRADVVDVDFSDKVKKLTLKNGDVLESKSVIIATGAAPRKLGCPGEKEFTGKGVSYCATCDADFFTDLEVFVVGSGNSAVEEATYLTKFARKVTLLVRGDHLKCDKTAEDEAKECDNLSMRFNTSIKEIKGEGILESIVMVDKESGNEEEYHCDEDDGTMGVFVFVGTIPYSDVFKGKIELDDYGYVLADEEMHTNVEGVYVAGDVRQKTLRQVVTAAADGAIAATQAEKYVDKF